MATAIIMDFAGGTADQYDAVIDKMGLGGRNAPGAVFHAAGPTDDGWRVVDVWEDMDAFQAFSSEKIGPLTQAAGLPEPKLQFVEVDELVDDRQGGTGDVTMVQVVRLPGMTRQDFLDADAQIRDDKELPEGCMFTVNGPTEDGWLVSDGWTSKELRDAFIAEKVAPVMQAAGATPPAIEDLPIHNTLTTA